MSWTSFHRRDRMLREVIAVLDARGDGVLPMDLEGLRDVFDDEGDLLGALRMRWHTRWAGEIERALMSTPGDPEAAATAAWHETARAMPGVRAALDRHHDALGRAPHAAA